MSARPLALLAVVLGTVLAALAVAPPARAQVAEPGEVALGATLVDLDAVVGATDDDAAITTVLELAAGPADRDGLRLVTTVFTRAEDRAGLRAALDGDLGSVFSAASTPLDDLAAGTTRLVTTTTDTDELALRGDDRAGVYPLQLQVFDGPEPIAELLTSIIVVPEDAPAPWPATTVLRVRDDATPVRDDVASADMEAALAPGGPLDRATATIAGIVQDGSAAGITAVADGRLLEDLADLSDGFLRPDGTALTAQSRVARRAGAALAAVAGLAGRGDVETLAYPYGPADLVALARGGLGEEALRLLEVGRASVAGLTGTTPTAGIIAPPDGLDAQAVAALGPANADAVLLDEAYLTFADDDALEPVRRLRTADGGEVRVLVPDADLSVLLGDPADQGTTAVVQQLLAETAVAWLADDTTDPAAGLLLAVDASSDPDVLAAATAAVAEAPWLRPVGLSTLRGRTSPSTRLVRLAYPPQSAASELPPSYVARLGQARGALVPVDALLPDDDPRPARYTESLQAVASTAYRAPEARAAGIARADQVVDALTGLSEAVAVVPSAPVTLTATTGEVPITVTNAADVPVDLRVAVQASRFDFGDGDTQTLTLPARSSQRLIFQAEALTAGGFAPIAVRVTDPTGTWALETTRMSVRSTAVPIVGLIATVGSVLVLVVWGVRQTRRRRRAGRHEQRGDRAAPAA